MNRQPIPNPFRQGFYEISGFSRYVISEEGVVIEKETGVVETLTSNPAGYRNYLLYGDNGKRLTWGRHRLMMFVFRHPGVPIEDLVVNHINGIKGDDWLDNLEWTTHQGNIEHAGRHGLTTKCIPCVTRDIDTGEIKHYPSVIACAKDIGLSKDQILYRLKHSETRLYPERLQYRKGTNGDNWLVVKSEQFGKERSLDIRYTQTGVVRTFPSLAAASRELTVPVPTLHGWVNMKDQPVLPGFIQLRYSDDPSPWRIPEDPYRLTSLRGQKRVTVFNTVTNKTNVFDSAKACAEAKGLLPTTLNLRLKSNGEKVYSDGCTYRY